MKIATTAVVLALILTTAGSGTAEDLSKIPEIKGAADLEVKPNVQYPYDAKRSLTTGSGIAVVNINSATGEVTAVRMGKSTGSAILDSAVTSAFRTARFRKGTVSRVKIPVTFTLTGSGRFYEYVDVKAKKMDDVLAHFLGKGTVLKGPIPAYPRNPPWTDKSGKGVYELHADIDGKVSQVKILKSSGDVAFDREAVNTLGKWRLRRGRPLILELPLRFQLTPTNYSVEVGR